MFWFWRTVFFKLCNRLHSIIKMSREPESSLLIFIQFQIFLCFKTVSGSHLQIILGISGKAVAQNLVSFLHDDKGIRIDLHDKLL